MLLDSKLAFSTDQAIETTENSENFPLDTGYANPNLGKGPGEIGVNFIVKTSLAAATSVRLDVYHGASSADTLLISSRLLLQAEIVAGFTYFLPLPNDMGRYVGLTYTVDGNAGGGTVDAFLGVKQ